MNRIHLEAQPEDIHGSDTADYLRCLVDLRQQDWMRDQRLAYVSIPTRLGRTGVTWDTYVCHTQYILVGDAKDHEWHHALMRVYGNQPPTTDGRYVRRMIPAFKGLEGMEVPSENVVDRHGNPAPLA